MTKLKLGNSENYIEVEVIYKVKENLEKTDIFVITEELLSQYDIPLAKFVDFLQKELPFEDPHYMAAEELWASNKVVFSKMNAKHSSNLETARVSRIITNEIDITFLEESK